MPLKTFADLTEREVLALAISQRGGRLPHLPDLADQLREPYPHSADSSTTWPRRSAAIAACCTSSTARSFGEHLPPIRREDVKGFSPPPDLADGPPGSTDAPARPRSWRCRRAASTRRPRPRRSTPSVRELLGDLAEAERGHEQQAGEIAEGQHAGRRRGEEEATRRRLFVLQYVQPGLAGLMDGSVSTLAPLFAAAFATHSNWETFLVGLAASIGAGISMGFAEALSDDGTLTGRGAPWMRGASAA